MPSKRVVAHGRRAEALAAAEACIALLKERFGARRVIPFGSLMGDGPWHESSDLDLAVEGLSPGALWEDDFYASCERICERVGVALDGGLPQGRRWHQLLLGQMGEPGGEGRTPLFDEPLLSKLDEHRRFRHRVRHRYGHELDPQKVLALARAVQPTLERVETAVELFGVWLEAQARNGWASHGAERRR